VIAEREHRLGRLGGDRDDAGRRGRRPRGGLERGEVVVERRHVVGRAFRQQDAVRPAADRRREVVEGEPAAERVAAHIPLDPLAPMRFEKRPRQLASHRPVGRRHRVLEVEDQCVGPAFEPLGELPLAVGWNEQERAHSHPRHLINAARRQIATVSPCWLSPTCSNSTMPASARDLLRRRLTTVVRAWIVSPWKTGFGNRTSLIPRLATVVPSVVSPTEMPITSPSVKMLLTSGRPNSVVLANSASRCSGCGFIVIVVNSTLSASVTVRVRACSKTCPSLNSSK